MTAPEGRGLNEAAEEELRKFSGPGGVLACRWCSTCDHHYRFCQCAEPTWVLRSEGKFSPLPGEPGGPVTLGQRLRGER